MELNPNHKTTQSVHDQWYKLCALIMVKLGLDHVVITPSDLFLLMDKGAAITVQELEDGIHLRIIDAKLGDAIARKEGGLPS